VSRGVRNGEVVPLPIRLGGLGSVVSSPAGSWAEIRGRAPPAENEFCAFNYFVIKPFWWKINPVFIDNYSITIEPAILKKIVEIHKSSIII